MQNTMHGVVTKTYDTTKNVMNLLLMTHSLPFVLEAVEASR